MLPLRYPGQHRAPWSPASCTRLPQSSMFPSSCSTGWERLSTTLVASRRSAFSSRIPVATPGHSLAFDSLTSCEVDDILRSGCYPCVVQANTEPPGSLPPSPGSCIHRCCPSLEHLYGRPGRLRFPRLSPLPTQSFSPFGTHSLIQAMRHSFLSLRVGVARPRPRYARYPSPFRRERTPWPPPSCARLPLLHPFRRTSLSPERRRLSRASLSRSPRRAFNLAVLRATWAR